MIVGTIFLFSVNLLAGNYSYMGAMTEFKKTANRQMPIGGSMSSN
jgi:hypothetical protein